MQLKLLSTEYCQTLLDFETENSQYFEASVPPRPATYFKYDSLYKIIKNIEAEQQAGDCFLYLVFKDNQLIGRANLVDIYNGTAELGYRLAESATGKGYATKILSELITIASTTHKLKRINAHTTTNNAASIRVLEKNSFKHIKVVKNAATLNNQSLDFTYFYLNL